MRTAQGFTRRFTAVSFVLFAAFLLGATTPHSYAASPGHTCAPLAPPPVPGSPAIPPATPGSILFNEILTTPGSTWNCAEPAGTYTIMSDAWVELYDPQSQPYNLYAAHAYMDTGPNTPRFYLPFGAAIAPHGFLVVFPNTAAGSTLLAGSNLRLMFAASSTPIDQVSVPGLGIDYAYVRIPDGSPNWKITATPTIDASNIISSSATPTPNPTPSSSQGSGGSGGGSGPTPVATTPVLATGTQPAWNGLSLPPATAAPSATSSAVNTPQVNTSASPSASAVSDVPRRILLTFLLVLLAGSLFWCWKVYSSS